MVDIINANKVHGKYTKNKQNEHINN
jgi:hypothetical protein